MQGGVQEQNFSNWSADGSVTSADQCDVLTNIARSVGRAAGYLQGRSRNGIITDAQRLLLNMPERSLLAAAGVGLLLGTVLRNRS